MKIAFLHQTLGLVDRGSEISTDILAAALTRKHKVIVIQAGPRVKKKYQTYRSTKQLVPLNPAPTSIVEKVLFRVGWDARTRAVAKFTHASIPILRRFRPDIIVATNGANQVKILKHIFPDARIVVFGRAGIGHDDQANLAARPDLFVALSEQARLWAQRIAHPRTRVVYIPNPLAPVPRSTGKVSLSDMSHPVVLIVSALSAYKNVPTVIRVCAQLGVNLVLIGDGEQSDEVSALLSTYPAEFRWLKHVSPRELPAYYHAADAFCFVPDSQEAFGRVYLEAMAARLPIVGSDDPIRRELLGPAACYADPHDEKDIGSKLVQALALPRQDYHTQLAPFAPATVARRLEKELYALS